MRKSFLTPSLEDQTSCHDKNMIEVKLVQLRTFCMLQRSLRTSFAVQMSCSPLPTVADSKWSLYSQRLQIKHNRQQNSLELNLSIFTSKLTLIHLNSFQSAIAQQIRQVSTIYSQQQNNHMFRFLSSQTQFHSSNIRFHSLELDYQYILIKN